MQPAWELHGAYSKCRCDDISSIHCYWLPPGGILSLWVMAVEIFVLHTAAGSVSFRGSTIRAIAGAPLLLTVHVAHSKHLQVSVSNNNRLSADRAYFRRDPTHPVRSPQMLG
jgi:hypothetical protein